MEIEKPNYNEMTENVKKKRLETFLKDYVFSLAGFTRKQIINEFNFEITIEKKMGDSDNICKIINFAKLTTIFVHVDTVKIVIKTNSLFSDEQKALTSKLVEAYSVAFKQQNTSTDSIKYRNSLYKFAVDRGISSWIVENKKEYIEKIDKLFECLENWSLKTYEGHNVCFGIIVDTSEEALLNSKKENNVGDFVSFLNEEYAAVLSDGITSLFEINKNCQLLNYLSITSDDIIDECSLDTFAPYRFAQVIKKYTATNKVGIFLLINGDIILCKNANICFIKRNGRWLNFNYETFKGSILNSCKINDELLKSIYLTMLDISLSHGGGIISVIAEEDQNWIKEKDSLLNSSDLLNVEINYDEMFKKEFEKSMKKNKTSADDQYGKDRCEREAKKKITKSYYLNKIMNNKKNFQQLDRKLRCELSCLDGACIMNSEGRIISFGAIIQNDAGSQGGGRGAAARKLSNFGGFAIKISTDGYIEVYSNGLNIYSIK